MNLVKVLVRAPDALTEMVIGKHLDSLSGVEVVSGERHMPVDVAVMVAERMSVEVMSTLRKVKETLRVPVVLIPGEIDPADLLAAVDCNVVAVLPRAAATSDRIEEAVLTAAAGGGALPPSILGELLRQVEQIQREVLSPNGLHFSGLTPREIDVLRLLSHGLDTAEIAAKLCFSERAVKKVIFGITRRLNLRNRPHAVAYALRTGVI
ncbi:response regulator transcription factor [Kutzneria buriramensis]|uniref:DNA-binding NarL/FixJ family response regulator n=1 Tax=Kutzneria buriramensis TaxID=1045776 RepID=A0A3E0GYD0_9PSEU|nr:DNA-binding NarL/FixJ family response regulator [Kutzneria buriramensis]